MTAIYQRKQAASLRKRLEEPRRFIQVITGPRQIGKTTLVLQATERSKGEVQYASADDPMLKGNAWIEQQWETARAAAIRSNRGAVLILDEIQKIPQWSETVKRLWDSDTRKKIPLRVVLLGSSPLLLQRGLSETLAGRFEQLYLTHWSFPEMETAFGWTLEQYLAYGGYPGAAALIEDHNRWFQYINDALIETTVARDILLMQRVDKPALLRQLFSLGCAYSGQIVSYQKLVGQLQDAGNTTTLSHYLTLLSGAGMMTGLEKYSPQKVRQRASSPKLLVLNTALLAAQRRLSMQELQRQPEVWGRLVETAVGAHLYNSSAGTPVSVHYWREGPKEVDFVLSRGRSLTAVEVKSGRTRENLSGMEHLKKLFPSSRALLVGTDGIPVDEFLRSPASAWID
jgi:predicted AAA+ superfamily ATPase